jgi:2-hydroxy-3-oxopropionate reductase
MANNADTKIGFIGLGIMGRPMVRNLLKAGFPVTVWNRSRPGIDACIADGAAEAASPRDVAATSDIVITIVGDSPDVEAVALGSNGIIEGAHESLVHIDMTTQSPEVTRRIAERLVDAGIEMLDAPVSGGETGAINGTLSIMVGGKEPIFKRCRPAFEAMGKTLVYCGPTGSGQVVKLCNQVAVSVTNLAVCEAITLCQRSGVDPRRMLEAVGAGAGASWQLANLGPKMLDGDFRAGFKAEHQLKDLGHALDTAYAGGAALPATTIAHELFARLKDQGLGAEGTQALFKVIQAMATEPTNH